MTLIKRSDKGEALTYEEMDGNFTHLGGDGSYQFPATDGTVDQVLTTDGQGNLSFQTISLENITGDLKGSVFADDSTKLVDAVEGKIVGPVEANVTGNLVGNTTGTHQGNVVADDSTVLVEAYSGTVNLSNTSITSLLDVNYSSPTSGDVLKWDGAKWAAQPESGAAVSASNADLLDGFDGSYYLDATNFTNVTVILQQVYPIGSIYVNASNSTNPATLLGFGTWIAFGGGRVPVGYVDGGDADGDYGAAEGTGGGKETTLTTGQLPDHGHRIYDTTLVDPALSTENYSSHRAVSIIRAGGQYRLNSQSPVVPLIEQSIYDGSTPRGDQLSVDIRQPYITVYMWKRTA